MFGRVAFSSPLNCRTSYPLGSYTPLEAHLLKLRLVSEINPRISEKRDKDREKGREEEVKRRMGGGNKRTRSTDDNGITAAFSNSTMIEKGDALFVPPLPSTGRAEQSRVQQNRVEKFSVYLAVF